MKTRTLILAALAALALSSCNNHAGWGIKGTLNDAEPDTKLVVEANNAGFWYTLDSIAVGQDGKFEYQSAAPLAGQDILRLTLPGKGSVYFPIDSIDQLTLVASAANFGTGHSLGGSHMAEQVSRVDSILATDNETAAKQRQLIDIITSDTTCLVAYYTLGKSIDGALIFDPTENLGNRVYGAVAQLYDMRRPADNRSKAVMKTYLEGRRALGKLPLDKVPVIEVPETGFFEIELYDARGQKQSLTEVAKGKTVILNFTTNEHVNSPALNSLLNDIYTRYRSQGLEIYQVAFDSDEVSWRESARSLPWVAVWNAPADGNSVLINYNVRSLPTTYIIDKNGTLVERVENAAELQQKVAKHI